MKRILTALLALSMLITTLLVAPLNVSAETAESADKQVVSIADTDEKVKDSNDVEYTVVRDLEGLKAMSAGGNYILANDITITTKVEGYVVNAPTNSSNIVLEGNGFDINISEIYYPDGNTDTSTRYAFFESIDGVSITVRHLTINVGTATIGKYCAIVYGRYGNGSNSNVDTISTEYVTVNVTKMTQVDQNAGVFAATNSAYDIVNFTGCKITGNINLTASQTGAGAYIGNNSATTTFTDCTLDANITVKGKQKGGFVGIQSSNSMPIVFNNCTVKGTIMGDDTAESLGAYIGDITGNASTTGTVSFNDCVSSAKILGKNSIGGFIGAISKPKTIAFNKTETGSGCVFNGALTSQDSAGAFVGYGTSANLANVSATSATNNGAIICGAAAATAITGESTENVNVIAGTTVTYHAADGETAAYYSYVIPGTDGAPTPYYQTTAEVDGKVNVRAIIVVDGTKLEDISEMDLTLTFGLKKGGSKTLALDETNINCYSSVYAGDLVAEAPENYVILAVVVKNVVVDEWNESLSVVMSAKNSADEDISEYLLQPQQ